MRALLLATSSGARSCGSAMFSVHGRTHDPEHVRAGLLVPALRSPGATRVAQRPHDAPPGPREMDCPPSIRRSQRSCRTRSPHSCCSSGSLYVVYFTPLSRQSGVYHWGHEFMALHSDHWVICSFLGIIGVDPDRAVAVPRPAGVVVRHHAVPRLLRPVDDVLGVDGRRQLLPRLALPWVPAESPPTSISAAHRLGCKRSSAGDGGDRLGNSMGAARPPRVGSDGPLCHADAGL